MVKVQLMSISPSPKQHIFTLDLGEQTNNGSSNSWSRRGHDAATVSTVALADGDHDASTISPCRWCDLSPEESRGVEKSGDVRGRRANGAGTATRVAAAADREDNHYQNHLF